MRLSVPGNLLLLGEYAVTEEGGLGLALAVDRRVSAEVHPADALVVEGFWGSGRLRWTPSKAESSALIRAIVDTWRRYCSTTDPKDRAYPNQERASILEQPRVHIRVDSSALFVRGRKGGFGSSAAVAVALSCVLLSLYGFEGAELMRAAAGIALEAHRRAQGGRGSGYDIYASLYGGFGCLTGGAQPQWRAVQLPWLPPMYLFRGPESVSTSGSLGFYERWKEADPPAFQRFLERSNQNVVDFLQSGDWPGARRSFEKAARLGLELGQRIGVSAAITAPESLDPGLYKAVGAGNELGIYVAEKQKEEPRMELVEAAAEGVRWNT